MRGSQCLFSSAVALRSVFVSNALAAEVPGHLRRLLRPALAVSSLQSSTSSSSSSLSKRPFSTQYVFQFRNSRRGPGTGDSGPASFRSMRDHDIVYPWVQLRQEDGSLGEPQRTNTILRSLDLERYSLVLLAAPRRDRFSRGPEYPVARIVDKKAERAQAERDAARRKAQKVVTKEIELNWAIAPHDLGTRMTQLKKFLGKGYRVQVTLAHPIRKDKRRASLEEAEAVLETVKQTVTEVKGTKEYKSAEGKVGGLLIMHLQGPRKKKAEAGSTAEGIETTTDGDESAADGDEGAAEGTETTTDGDESTADGESSTDSEPVPTPQPPQ